MGVVYRARDRVLGRAVALKELPAHFTDNPQLAARFRREARALARLSHPHIVQVYDLVEAEGKLWMTMELVTGDSLESELERENRLPLDRALELAQQMAEALAHAHEEGVIHRDFKPANVMVDRTGRAKVADFGIAKLSRDPKLTQAGAILGSPAYMSPEQATGDEADARTDVYAFGATFYEMLTGAPPFDGHDVASVLMQHITTPPVPPSDKGIELPESLEALVLATLAKKREERPASMHEIAETLRRGNGYEQPPKYPKR
jgi:serine/threonine-protein kinase